MEEEGALLPACAPVFSVGFGVDVAVDEEEVEPAVVVVVEEGVAPAEEGDGGFGGFGLVGDVGEVAVAVVAVDGFVVVGEGGVEEVDAAGVGEVSGGDSHGGGLAATAVKGVSGGVAGVFEGSVALVEVEVVGGGVVAYEEVGAAVVIDVDEERGEAVVGGFVGDTGFEADVFEGAVAFVAEEVVGFSLEAMGAAHDADSAEGAEAVGGIGCALGGGVGEVVVDVAGDEEVELAVAAVVSPGGSGGPVAKLDSGLLGNVGEGSVMVVVVEAVFAEVGDVDVGVAVVVVVGDGGSEAPAVVGDSGFGGDVGEGSVVVVVEEGGVGGGGLAGHGFVGAAVDEVDVEPAVVVVVEEGYTGAYGVENVVLLWGSHAVVEGGQAGLCGDVFEGNGAGMDEAAGGNGGLGWLAGLAGGHALLGGGLGAFVGAGGLGGGDCGE